MLALAAPAAAIERFCDEREARARATPPVAAYVRIYDGGGERVTWRVADRAARRRIARDPDIYSDVATVWMRDGKIAVVTFATRSLDFRADATYCFRPGGSLARASESSSGTNNRDDESRELDERGTIVGRTSQMGPLYPAPGATVAPGERPAVPELYRTVRALPFYALWRSRWRNASASR